MKFKPLIYSTFQVLGLLFLCLMAATVSAEEQTGWKLHTIDNTSRGADGVKLADVNGDGLLDIATGWEEGGVIRLYLQPPLAERKNPWPMVTVGKVKSPEDAFFADANLDGQLDLISCCEGKTRTVYAHLAPGKDQLMQESLWKTVPLAASAEQTCWMFGLGADLDQDPYHELFCGSKEPGGRIGYFDPDSTSVENSLWVPVRAAGWIMSLFLCDVEGDGDLDLVYSDRRGKETGCWFLENPGDGTPVESWKRIPIGGQHREVMFLSSCKINKHQAFVAAVREREVHVFIERGRTPLRFETWAFTLPASGGTAKAAALVDLDESGTLDLVVSCENAQNKHGVFVMHNTLAAEGGFARVAGRFETISGVELGIKYDRFELLDLDEDGDLDLLTCEERDNLGVIWYENPLK